MTTHEILTSLLWLIAGGYAAYLAWFATQTLRSRYRGRDAGSSEH